MHREKIQDDARDNHTEDLPSFYNDIDLESLLKAVRPEQYGEILRVALGVKRACKEKLFHPRETVK